MVPKISKPKGIRAVPPEDIDMEVQASSWEEAQEWATDHCYPVHTDRWKTFQEAVQQAPLCRHVVDCETSLHHACQLEEFGQTMDAWKCTEWKIREDKRQQHIGAMRAPRIRLSRLIANGHGVASHPKVAQVIGWSAIEAHMVEVITELQRQDGDGNPSPTSRRMPTGLSRWLCGQIDLEDSEWHKTKMLTLCLRTFWVDMCSPEQAECVLKDIKKHLAAAEARLRSHRTQESKLWAHEAAQGAASAAFNFVKSKGGSEDGTRMCIGGTAVVLAPVTYDPNEAMAQRSATWNQHWQAHSDSKQAISDGSFALVIRKLKLAAEEAIQDESEITAEQVEHHSAKIKRRTALGSDSTAPITLCRLPLAGKQELAEMMNSWIKTLCLPLQALCNLMAVIPKPDQAGERLVALMTMVVRVLFRCKRWHISEWEDGLASFWDQAVRGSSALRAAIHRSYALEVHGILGVSSAIGFTDVENLYDSLDPIILVEKVLHIGFPAVSLLLHLQAHWGPRLIQYRGIVSEYLLVSRSILAGCTSSNSLSRGYLYHVCERMHYQLPRVQLRTFVDDIVLYLFGPKAGVIKLMVQALASLFRLLGEAKLTVARDKGILVGSEPDVAREISRTLAMQHGMQGIVMRPKKATKDLGVVCAGGLRRSSLMFQTRKTKAAQKVVRAGKFARMAGLANSAKTKRLWAQSVEPAIMYGATMAGLTSRQLKGNTGHCSQGTGLQE